MPNLTAHVALALEARKHLAPPVLEACKATYVLGATAPDIRILTRSRRDETHFAPLDSTELRAGVKGLFCAHPTLADPRLLNQPTLAFVLGYLSHLVSDQLWVIELYRPFFGNREVFEDHATANVLDRALQLELDRQGLQAVDEVRPLLAGAEEGVAVGFIATPTLRAWRVWVEQALAREFTWERLRSLARRQDPSHHPQAIRVAEQFLEAIPEGLEQIYQRVPREKLSAYRQRCIEELVKTVEEYLHAPAPRP